MAFFYLRVWPLMSAQLDRSQRQVDAARESLDKSHREHLEFAQKVTGDFSKAMEQANANGRDIAKHLAAMSSRLPEVKRKRT